MTREWQDRRVLELLADHGPLEASVEPGAKGSSFVFRGGFQGQSGGIIRHDPAWEESRVRRLAHEGLLEIKPGPLPGEFTVAITARGDTRGGISHPSRARSQDRTYSSRVRIVMASAKPTCTSWSMT